MHSRRLISEEDPTSEAGRNDIPFDEMGENRRDIVKPGASVCSIEAGNSPTALANPQSDVNNSSIIIS